MLDFFKGCTPFMFFKLLFLTAGGSTLYYFWSPGAGIIVGFYAALNFLIQMTYEWTRKTLAERTDQSAPVEILPSTISQQQ